MKQQW